MDFKESVKDKWEDFKETVSNGIADAADWASRNPVLTVAMITLGMRATGGVYKAVRTAKKDAEKEKARLEDWDPRAGHYVPRSRELTGQEWAFIDEEKKKGRLLTDIYREMGVLGR